MAEHVGDGHESTGEVVRADDPASKRSRYDRWWRGASFAVWAVRLYVGVVWQDWPPWTGVLPPLVLLGLLGQRAWRRRHPRPTSWVSVGAVGVARSEAPELVTFAELMRVDGHERWPNLRLHTRTAQVDLFPWAAAKDDVAAAAVAQAVLERATAAGIDTTPRPIAMWRPTRHEIDWDRAVTPPSRWSRSRSSSADPTN